MNRTARDSFWAVILLAAASPAFAAELDFARDVKPLLKQHCVKCHGPEKQP